METFVYLLTAPSLTNWARYLFKMSYLYSNMCLKLIFTFIFSALKRGLQSTGVVKLMFIATQ